MITPAYCTTMSRYNRWMNERLYAVCAGLSDTERKEDRGAPFKSIHGTLNHLLLADRLWLGRFTAVPFTTARSLDQELYADFAELCRERALTDSATENWVASLTEERLATELTFTMMSRPGQVMTLPLWIAATHFFNHQTHHRGQLTTLLEQFGCDFGITDLIAMPPA